MAKRAVNLKQRAPARKKPRPARAVDQGAEKLGTIIAGRIEAEISRAGWRVGRSLGSESELMERYNVSRSTLREAIRQLEAHGAVRMRRGTGGGLVVSEEPHQAAERALAVYLELLNAGVDELFEARKVLEPFAARLASERGSEQNIHKLRTLINRLEAASPPRLDTVVPLHVALRSLIGEMASNPALTIFVDALNRYTVEAISHEITSRFPATSVDEAAKYKRAVVEAIVGHLPFEAELAMRRDLDNRYSVLRSPFAARAMREITDAPSIIRVKPGGIHPKLAQIAAMTIAHEIHRSKMQVGDRLGAEPELLQKYGISRAVFREAIRILELHGFVRTRRGHAGGLLVSSPDPTYTISSATGFLLASKMNRDHFKEVRKVLAVSAAELAAKRIDAKGRALLAERLAAHLSAVGTEATTTARRLHELVGELSGNRAISLFNRVLLDLNTHHPEKGLPKPLVPTLRRNNERICEAISAGDEPLARRRMVEHMRDVAEWTEKGYGIFT